MSTSLDTKDPPGTETLYSISEMAQEFGITLRALRFYEDKLLISPIRVGVARLYDERTRRRLRTILKGKLLGFTLTEIRDLLANSESRNDSDCDLALEPDQVEAQLTALIQRRDQIEAAIEELQTTAKRIKEKAQSSRSGAAAA